MSRFFSRVSVNSFAPQSLVSRAALVCLTAALACPVFGYAQSAETGQDAAQMTMQTPAPAEAKKPAKAKKSAKAEKPAKAEKAPKSDGKLVPSKDTKKMQKKTRKTDPLAGVDSKLPDKQLYDKAMAAMKKGKYDVARLDLQTMLNTYPDSQFQMRAKLAIGDSWYKEGGSAALTQAESEYKDFITFFPNAPEAAEAQMKVADIYYRQMDKPDRDYTNAKRAQEEYRNMIQQFPDSPLVPQAKQQLRQVQEVLATREAGVAAFYASHENWSATIARYQSLVDAYPLYSHIDDALIGLGDAYSAEAHIVSTMKLPEGPKAELEKSYKDKAAQAYDRVATRYAAAQHVDDAKDRLSALGYPIPVPTAADLARSEAEEQSRANVTLRDRALIMITSRPDYVSAARIGEPTMVDPKPTLAPDITKASIAAFQAAMNPAQAGRGPAEQAAAQAATQAADTLNGTPTASTDAAAAQAAPAQAAGPVQLQDVPTVSTPDVGSSATITDVPAGSSGAAPAGNSNSLEVVQPGSAPATGASAPPTTPADDNGGLKAVGPTNNTVLPAIEQPAAAPDTINDVKNANVAQPQTAAAGKKAPKPAFDAKDDSSNKHKKKKGLGKLNPF